MSHRMRCHAFQPFDCICRFRCQDASFFECRPRWRDCAAKSANSLILRSGNVCSTSAWRWLRPLKAIPTRRLAISVLTWHYSHRDLKIEKQPFASVGGFAIPDIAKWGRGCGQGVERLRPTILPLTGNRSADPWSCSSPWQRTRRTPPHAS